MAIILDKQRRMVTVGDGQVDLQEWKVERLADFTFEYHSYVGHNFSQGYGGTSGVYSKGAVFMIMRLTDPGQVEEMMEYHLGRTGLPGSGNDTLLTAWTNRAVISYYRYDEILQQFFNG